MLLILCHFPIGFCMNLCHNQSMKQTPFISSVQSRTTRLLINLKASTDPSIGAMVAQYANLGTVGHPRWRKLHTAFARTANYHDIEDYLGGLGFVFVEYREPNPRTPEFDGWYVFDRVTQAENEA